MKTLLVLFLFLLSLLSCQDTNRSGKDVSEDMEEPVDTTPKATAIFWIKIIRLRKKTVLFLYAPSRQG